MLVAKKKFSLVRTAIASLLLFPPHEEHKQTHKHI